MSGRARSAPIPACARPCWSPSRATRRRRTSSGRAAPASTGTSPSRRASTTSSGSSTPPASRSRAQRGCAPDDEIVAAVLGAGLVVVPIVLGLLRSEADGRDPRRRDAEVDEVVLGGAGAVLPEREVVLDGAELVAVPLDPELPVGPPDLRGDLLQHRAGLGPDERGVEVEEDR